MAFPTYGKLLLAEYTEQPASAILRTEMESGPPKQAMIKSRVMVTRSLTYIYTASEFASFKVWVRDTISRGADWFDYVDPADGATKQGRLVVSQNGSPYSAKATTSAIGSVLSWEVSMQVETWEA